MKIRSGSIHILTAYDVAFEIRLSQVPVLFGDRQRDSARFAFLSRGIHRETQPVTMIFDSVPIEFGGKTLDFDVSCTFFDLGAFSIELMLPLEATSLSDLPRIAASIQNSQAIAATSRRIADEVFNKARSALVSPELSKWSSTYTIFNVHGHDGPSHVEDMIEEQGRMLAQTLRASEDPMGDTELKSALRPYVTYSDQDVVFASPNIALLFDETSSDVVDIFELANAQSAEIRYIDSRLDRTLQGLYDENDQRPSLWGKLTNVFEIQLKKLNTIHLDATILVDRVENSFKFSQDSYLVQIHELAVQKMLIPGFLKTAERKLQSVREITSDLRDRASHSRMEILEWIVIILIAIEVLPAVIGRFH